MIKLSFQYKDEPFTEAAVTPDWQAHPTMVSSLLDKMAQHEAMSGEMVLHYTEKGPQNFQIERLYGVPPQKIVELFSKLGFRPRVY